MQKMLSGVHEELTAEAKDITPVKEKEQEDTTEIETVDTLDEEINMDNQIIMEQTRYTTMNRMIENAFLKFHTNLSKDAIKIIMLKKNWIEAYLIFMQPTFQFEDMKLATLKTITAHQKEIVNYMELQLAKDGYRANQIFKTLQGDEKLAKRVGDFFRRGNDYDADQE